MIRLVTRPDMNETRMFDLTAGEDEFLGMIQGVEDESYAVLMVEREDDESFFDAHEPVVEEIEKATVVAMDLQDLPGEHGDGRRDGSWMVQGAHDGRFRRRHFSVA